MGIRVLLEEIGAPYELIQTSVEKDTPRPPEQIAVNPNGWVPVLLWENGAMYEAAAITIFLGDRHPKAQLAPTIDDPSRAVFSANVGLLFQLGAKRLSAYLLP